MEHSYRQGSTQIHDLLLFGSVLDDTKEPHDLDLLIIHTLAPLVEFGVVTRYTHQTLTVEPDLEAQWSRSPHSASSILYYMGFWFFGKKKEDEVNKLKEILRGSFSNIKKDIGLINDLLDNFRKKHDRHDEKFERLERDLVEIRQLLTKRSKMSSDYDNGGRSIVHERSRAFKLNVQSFMNVQSLKKLKNYLTPAQKRVIQLLNISEIPLEYEDIAKELKLSVVTVRRHINDIKRMGFQIKEKTNIDTNRKVFYIERAVKRMISNRK